MLFMIGQFHKNLYQFNVKANICSRSRMKEMILIRLPIRIYRNDFDQMIGLDVLETLVIENILNENILVSEEEKSSGYLFLDKTI